jgi:hypothetical protein
MKISDIMERNRDIGHHFFDPDTLAFFRGKVLADTFGPYFVTSEQARGESRRYTVRQALPDGSIETVGMFQQYETRAAALAAARKYWQGSQSTASETDEHAATELALYMENTEWIYTRHLVPTYRNYEKKIRKGTFNRQLAIDGMARNVCTVAARAYHAEHCESGRWNSLYPVAVRVLVATDLVDYLVNEINAGNSWLGATS